jgi:hypothetical protein
MRQAPPADRLRTTQSNTALVTFEDDPRALERPVAHYVSVLLHRLFHRSSFRR